MNSPCVRLCVIEEETGLCAGCGRTLDEIGSWSAYSDAERRRIMDDLPERRAGTVRETAAEISR